MWQVRTILGFRRLALDPFRNVIELLADIDVQIIHAVFHILSKLLDVRSHEIPPGSGPRSKA
jgi:hypothetical protein